MPRIKGPPNPIALRVLELDMEFDERGAEIDRLLDAGCSCPPGFERMSPALPLNRAMRRSGVRHHESDCDVLRVGPLLDLQNEVVAQMQGLGRDDA